MKRRKFIAALVGLPAFAKAAVSLTAAPAPTISMQLVSSPVVAKPLKLKAVWTAEFEQELDAYYGIKAERVLDDVLKYYDFRQRD